MASYIKGIRRLLVGILLLVCAGCGQRPGDQLIGRWEGCPKGRIESPQDDEPGRKSLPTGSSDSSDASESKDVAGPGDRVAAERGVAPSGGVGTPSAQEPSLLDAFDVTIRLNFVDREHVQLSISGAGNQASRSGTWRVLDNDDEATRIEIVSPGISTKDGKPGPVDGAGPSAGKTADRRQFLVQFSGEDQFTLIDPVAPPQQGELVFRRVK